MKKLLYTLALIGGLFTMASCSDDDITFEKHGLQIVKAETTIEAAGGSATIEAAAPVVQAYTNSQWASVSVQGNTVVLTGEGNNSLESRTAAVVIKSSPLDSAIVNVLQPGVVFRLGEPISDITISDNAARYAYPLTANVEGTATSSVDWVKVSIEGDSLIVVVDANESGVMRRGSFTFGTDLSQTSVSVSQADVKDIYGYYLFEYATTYNPQSEEDYKTMLAVLDSETLSLPSEDINIPATVDADNFSIAVQLNARVGTYTQDEVDYALFSAFRYVYNNRIYYSNENIGGTLSGAVNLTNSGTQYCEITDYSDMPSLETLGLCILGYTGTEQNASNLAIAYDNYFYPTLYKLTNEQVQQLLGGDDSAEDAAVKAMASKVVERKGARK